MSLSRKLYLPKSLSFGAIRWSFLALANFIKRNSRRSIHSLSSWFPCAILQESSSVQVSLRYLWRIHMYQMSVIKNKESNLSQDARFLWPTHYTHLSQTRNVPVGNRYCQQFWSSSELNTLSLCFSEVICCSHCLSLLQFLPHSQQWLPACQNTENKSR